MQVLKMQIRIKMIIILFPEMTQINQIIINITVIIIQTAI